MSFFCLRIPHFGAWAAAQANSNLAQRVFAVCEKGQVFAPCPRALTAGITPGMSISRARARLDELHVVARDRSLESLAWNELQRTLYGLTPKIEPMNMGRLYCDVAHAKVARLVHEWNGAGFGVTGGCAGDRSTAHLAAILAPAGAVRAIRDDWNFAGKVGVESLLGEVSQDTIEHLHFFGWKTLSALRPLSRRQIEEQFNLKNMDGEALFRFAQGAKCRDNLRPVAEWRQPEEVSARIAFEFPATEPNEWEQGLADILIQVCTELGARSAQTLEICAETAAGKLSARRVLREPSNNPKTLSLPLHNALDEALRLLQPLPMVIQSLEIRLGNLIVPEGQIELWEDPRATRNQKLRSAFELLDERLPGKLSAVAPHQPDSPFKEDRWAWLNALEKIGVKRHATPTR